jgi:hypothetical protein
MVPHDDVKVVFSETDAIVLEVGNKEEWTFFDIPLDGQAVKSIRKNIVEQDNFELTFIGKDEKTVVHLNYAKFRNDTPNIRVTWKEKQLFGGWEHEFLDINPHKFFKNGKIEESGI